MLKVIGESFQSVGEFVKKNMGEAKNIAGEWGVDKSHGGEQKIRGGGLSRGVLLRGVLESSLKAKLSQCIIQVPRHSAIISTVLQQVSLLAVSPIFLPFRKTEKL